MRIRAGLAVLDPRNSGGVTSVRHASYGISSCWRATSRTSDHAGVASPASWRPDGQRRPPPAARLGGGSRGGEPRRSPAAGGGGR